MNNDTMYNVNLTNRQILTYFLNDWKHNMLARTVGLRHLQSIEAVKPDAKIPYMHEDGTPEPMLISDAISKKKSAIADAFSMVEIINGMLALPDEGEDGNKGLNDLWADQDAVSALTAPAEAEDDEDKDTAATTAPADASTATAATEPAKPADDTATATATAAEPAAPAGEAAAS